MQHKCKTCKVWLTRKLDYQNASLFGLCYSNSPWYFLDFAYSAGDTKITTILFKARSKRYVLRFGSGIAVKLLQCTCSHPKVNILLFVSLWSIWGSHKNYEVSLSQMLHDILGHDNIQWHPQLIRYHTNLRTYYRTGLYYRFLPYYQILEVSKKHCNGCG